MTTKDYLSQIRILSAKIDHLKMERDQLRSAMYSIRSPSDGEKVQSSQDPDKLGVIMGRLDDMEINLANHICELFDIRIRIINQIHELNNISHVQILYKRHVELKSWKKISEELNFSVRNVHYLHGHALQAFSDKFSVEYSDKLFTCFH